MSLDELYTRADAIVVTAPLNRDSKGMIDKVAFGKMKRGVVLVNVGKRLLAVTQWYAEMAREGPDH